MRKKMRKKTITVLILVFSLLFGMVYFPVSATAKANVVETDSFVTIQTDNYTVKVDKNGFRYGFYRPDGSVIADMHNESGICFGPVGTDPAPAKNSVYEGLSSSAVHFVVTNTNDEAADVRIHLFDSYVKFEIEPQDGKEGTGSELTSKVMFLEGSKHSKATVKKILNSELTNNYTMEADVKIEKGGKNSTGIFTHASGVNNFHLFFIKEGQVGLKRLYQGSSKKDFGSKDYNIISDVWYRLKMVVQGHQIQCYVNDELVYDVTDDSDDESVYLGNCGVRSDKQDSCIDNVIVYDNQSGKVYYENDFEDTTVEQLNVEWESPYGNPDIFLKDDIITPAERTFTIDARVEGINPLYGLGDYGAYGSGVSGAGTVRETSNVNPTERISAGSFTNHSPRRFVSNFTISPSRGFAQVLFEEADKRVSLNDTQTMLGVLNTKKVDKLYYFFGDMKQIYSDYRRIRNEEGYLDTKPHYEMFGLGWEAYGALGWNADQKNVEETIQDYLDNGYDITWGVVGSGFWPGERKGVEGSTVSFGMWDDTYQEGRKDGLANPRFPDPDGMKEFFQEKDIKLLLGIRPHFKVPASLGGEWDESVDGNFVNIGLENNYFLKNDDGSVFTIPTSGFPKSPLAIVDGDNPEAVEWYREMCKLWGVDGYKEDAMIYVPTYHDGNWNRIFEPMVTKDDALFIVRNAAYSCPGDILRINDANFGLGNSTFNNSPDRMPINMLSFAASGVSNAYPDIIGGTGGNLDNENYQKFLVRSAAMASLCPSYSVGINVLDMKNEQYKEAAFSAINWHSTYVPYIYDAALKSYETGYPVSMTPLYIAYPDDETLTT